MLQYKPKRLTNLGASCYFNSAMQAIYTPYVLHVLAKNHGHQFGDFILNFDFSDRQILQLFSDPKFEKFNKYFRLGAINSAFDCFSKIIEVLGDEIPDINTLFDIKKEISYTCGGSCRGKTLDTQQEIHKSFIISKSQFVKIQEFLLESQSETDIKCKNCGKFLCREELTRILPRIFIIRFSDMTTGQQIQVRPITIERGGKKVSYVPISLVYHSNGIPASGGHYNGIYMRAENAPKNPFDLNEYDYYMIDDDRVVGKLTVDYLRLTQGLEFIVYQRL